MPKAYTICVDLDSGHPHGHPCYGQLTAVKKVSADQCHLTLSGIRRFIEKVNIRRQILLFLSTNSVLRASSHIQRTLVEELLIIPRRSLHRGSTGFQERTLPSH